MGASGKLCVGSVDGRGLWEAGVCGGTEGQDAWYARELLPGEISGSGVVMAVVVSMLLTLDVHELGGEWPKLR